MPFASPAPPTISLSAVHKSFGGVKAVAGLSLEVPPGSITVLLGPNGAGKTTAIRLMTGALPADEGTVTTFGMSPVADGEEIRRRCGVVSAKPALYDRLTGWDNLLYAAALYGVKTGVDHKVREAAARFAIDDALDQKVGGYSTGMKTRLALSRALLHSPDLLLFDEPTSGLDPESAHAVLKLIDDMTDDGTTVVMCTHLLAEAEGLADQIVMLDKGATMLQGTQADLIHQHFPETTVRFDAENPELLDLLATRDEVLEYRRAEHATAIIRDHSATADLVTFLIRQGVRLTRVEPHVPTLEELYFRVRRAHAGDATEAPGEALLVGST